MNNSSGKVGIVTMQGRFNYGNRLQNYATSRIFEKLGYEAVSLMLHRRREPIRFIKDVVKTAIGKDTSVPESSLSEARLAAFDRFNNNMQFEDVYKVDSALVERYE